LLESNPRSFSTMQDYYVAPELKLAGEASEVVLGIPGVGGDMLGEAIVSDWNSKRIEVPCSSGTGRAQRADVRSCVLSNLRSPYEFLHQMIGQVTKPANLV
jgi:hypothetical protein